MAARTASLCSTTPRHCRQLCQPVRHRQDRKHDRRPTRRHFGLGDRAQQAVSDYADKILGQLRNRDLGDTGDL